MRRTIVQQPQAWGQDQQPQRLAPHRPGVEPARRAVLQSRRSALAATARVHRPCDLLRRCLVLPRGPTRTHWTPRTPATDTSAPPTRPGITAPPPAYRAASCPPRTRRSPAPGHRHPTRPPPRAGPHVAIPAATAVPPAHPDRPVCLGPAGSPGRLQTDGRATAPLAAAVPWSDTGRPPQVTPRPTPHTARPPIHEPPVWTRINGLAGGQRPASLSHRSPSVIDVNPGGLPPGRFSSSSRAPIEAGRLPAAALRSLVLD